MKNIVKFIPKTEEIYISVVQPKPAKLYMPEWYKNVPKFENNVMKINTLENGSVMSNATIKSCVPFLDSFLTGYIQETWCDILIEENNGYVSYKYSGSPEIISIRNKLGAEGIIDQSFYQLEFIWHQPWIPKLPSGYSMIYTHPFNRMDLPFVSATGIIDNDVFYHERQGNHPFYVKKGFSGIIPAGTPMFQMIPLKRDDWKSEVENFDPQYKYLVNKLSKYFYGGYKRQFWQKKNYY